MCTAATTTFSGLMAARFFIGVGEAAIGPGFSLIVGMFYKREEQPARQAAWFMGNCISMIIGGVVAYGVGNVHTGAVRSWQLLFWFWGLSPAAWRSFSSSCCRIRPSRLFSLPRPSAPLLSSAR